MPFLLSGGILSVAVRDIAGWSAFAIFLVVLLLVAAAMEVLARRSFRALAVVVALVVVASFGWLVAAAM